MIGHRLNSKTAGVLIAGTFITMLASSLLAAGPLQETAQQKAERMAWWTEARFGCSFTGASMPKRLVTNGSNAMNE